MRACRKVLRTSESGHTSVRLAAAAPWLQSRDWAKKATNRTRAGSGSGLRARPLKETPVARPVAERLEAEAQAVPARSRFAARLGGVSVRSLAAGGLWAVLHLQGPLPRRRLAASVDRIPLRTRDAGHRRPHPDADPGDSGVQ